MSPPDRQRAATTEVRPSPLDPFLRPFLDEVAAREDGFSPMSHGAAAAAAQGWPPSFTEVLFTSARGRGLIEPFRSAAARGRPRWRLSTRGAAWLGGDDRDGHSPANPAAQDGQTA